MRLEVVAVEELHRVRRHHRQAQLARQLHRRTQIGFRARMPRPLHLDVIAVRKACRPGACALLGGRGIAVEQRLADIAEHGARQADQVAGRAIVEPFGAHLGAATVFVGAIGFGQQLAQLAVALAVAADQQHPAGLVAIGVIRDPRIDTDDRLDPLATRALVEFDHAKQIGQIGDAQCRHAVGGSAGNGLADLHDSVGNRVFGVQAKMDEAGFGGRVHGAEFYRANAVLAPLYRVHRRQPSTARRAKRRAPARYRSS